MQLPTVVLRQNEPVGWVWVTQTVDLSKQFGSADDLFTLDGAPPPSLQRKRVSLGLVLDDQGHIITRLIDVTPNNPPADLTVRILGSNPTKAKFIGMDTVTGFCVIKVEGKTLKQATFAGQNSLLPRLNIRLYGFHPNQLLGSARLAMNIETPRPNRFSGQIAKAAGDFRYNPNNPIYYLLTPQLTPVQDCSLIFKDETVFGIALYDTGTEGKHLVYPISRVQAIAESVINSNQSIAYGWLGAMGRDVYAPIQTQISGPSKTELGVHVTAVAPDSPAEQAGVKAQDLLLSINDRRVETFAQMVTAIRQVPADSEISLRVKRGNEYKVLKAKLVPAMATDPEQQLFSYVRRLEAMKDQLKIIAATDPARQNLEARMNMMSGFLQAVTSPAPPEIRLRVFYGFEIESLTGQLMNYFAVTNGVLVSTVAENNKAARAGLQAGDVIVKVGDQPIANLATLLKALEPAQGEAVEITVSRRRELVKLALLH
ncbi:MAG: PDZ domain-containing protein [Acidobacteriota bacterium]